MIRLILAATCLLASMHAKAGDLEDEALLQRIATEDVDMQLQLLRRDLINNTPRSGANDVKTATPAPPPRQTHLGCLLEIQKALGNVTQAEIEYCRSFIVTGNH